MHEQEIYNKMITEYREACEKINNYEMHHGKYKTKKHEKLLKKAMYLKGKLKQFEQTLGTQGS